MSYINARREEEKDRRRNEIIDAALEMYREVGWDAVTMDSVAKRARLSRALIYVYFKDKRELHLAISHRAMQLLRERFEEAIARPALGIDKIEALGRAYIAYAHEFPYFFDAAARLETQVFLTAEAGTFEAECAEAAASVDAVVEEAIRIGQEDGSIRKDLVIPALTSRVMWGFTHGLIQIAMNKGHSLARAGINVPEFLQHAIALIRSALVAPNK
jgi:AcrR family transcriptional regulator